MRIWQLGSTKSSEIYIVKAHFKMPYLIEGHSILSFSMDIYWNEQKSPSSEEGIPFFKIGQKGKGVCAIEWTSDGSLFCSPCPY